MAKVLYYELNILQYALDNKLYDFTSWREARLELMRYQNKCLSGINRMLGSNAPMSKQRQVTIDDKIYIIPQFVSTKDVLPKDLYRQVRINYMWANMYKKDKQRIGLDVQHTTGTVPLNEGKFQVLSMSEINKPLHSFMYAILHNKGRFNFYIYHDESRVEQSMENYNKAIRMLENYHQVDGEPYHPISVWSNKYGLVKNMHYIVRPARRVLVTRDTDLYYMRSPRVREIYLGKIETPTVKWMIDGIAETFKLETGVPYDGRYIQEHAWDNLAKHCPNAKVYKADVVDMYTKKLLPVNEVKRPDEYVRRKAIRETYEDPEITEIMAEVVDRDDALTARVVKLDAREERAYANAVEDVIKHRKAYIKNLYVWIKGHGYVLNVSQFAKVHNLPKVDYLIDLCVEHDIPMIYKQGKKVYVVVDGTRYVKQA